MRRFVLLGATVALLSLTGVGFACGGGGCLDDHGSGCEQSSGLVWVAPTSTYVSVEGLGCTATTSDSTLTIVVNGMVPGSDCQVSATLKNTGDDSVVLSATLTHPPSPACPLYTYADDLLGLSHGPTVDGGHTFAYTGLVSLSATAGNACEHTSATFQVTISGGQGSNCGRDPFWFF